MNRLLILSAVSLVSAASTLQAANLFDARAVESFLSQNGYRGYSPSDPSKYNDFPMDSFRDALKISEGNVPYVYDDKDKAKTKAHLTSDDTADGYPTIGVGHLVRSGDKALFDQLFKTADNPTFDSQAVLDGKADLTQAQVDALADYDVNKRLDTLKSQLPDLGRYPPEVQGALLDMLYRGDTGPSKAGRPALLPDIAAGRWDDAIDNWMDFENDGDKYYNDPNYSGVKKRVDANKKILDDYFREQNVDALWTRAVVVGGQSIRFPDANGTMTNAEIARRRSFDVLAAVDNDNISRFQTGRFVDPGTSFQFTTPVSTGGLSDITVPANANFVFRLYDTAVEDGDIVGLTIASGSGKHVIGDITLTNAGRVITEFLRSGPVELSLTARNEGSLTPNTGGVQVTSPIRSGVASQVYNLSVGQTGVLRVIAK